MSNSFNLELFRKTYQGPTVRVKLVAAENAASYLPAIPFMSSKDVWDYFSPLEEEPREVVIATYVDNKHHVLSIEEVSRGTLTASLFEPRAILQGALLTNAAAVIVLHSHPSGDPRPSADDLHALVEYLKIERFHLVGVAGGGFAAYDYVLWHPERLHSLVVAASGGAVVDEELRQLREKTTLPGFRSWPPEFREVSMGYMATNPEGLKRWLEIHHNSQQKGALAQPQRTTITFEKLASIRVPTLLMPGDQDLQAPPWVMRRQLAHIPGAQFIVLPEAAHSINWEQPEAFNRNVLEFIRRD
jgi:proteasome lid subunit RPN8/RPN11